MVGSRILVIDDDINISSIIYNEKGNLITAKFFYKGTINLKNKTFIAKIGDKNFNYIFKQ